MMRDWVLPDQIHNYAHNNEWCIRNLIHVGRIQDAIDLAINMISLPRHPRFNTLKKRSSALYGRQRLIQVLSTFELWEKAESLAGVSILEPTDDPLEQVRRLVLLGRARYRSGRIKPARVVLQQLRDALSQATEEKAALKVQANEEQQRITDRQMQLAEQLKVRLPDRLGYPLATFLQRGIRRDDRRRTAEAVEQAVEDIDERLKLIRQAIDEMEGHEEVAAGNSRSGVEKLRQSELVDAAYCALVEWQAGEVESALEKMQDHVAAHENEVQPLAMLVWLLWQSGDRAEAIKTMQPLRELSSAIDLQSPVFERLAVVAEHAGWKDDWRLPASTGSDIGDRPRLASLGPFRWQPMPGPDWDLIDDQDQPVSLSGFQGQPVVVIFYLGHGCLHCAEQLQAFAPEIQKFRNAGIEVVAISTDDRDGLQQSLRSYGPERLPIRLLADPEQTVFKAYRAYDEFEDQPLHGTYLIDAEGNIRWLDIGYEPFMDTEFLLKESNRLLLQSG